MLKKGMFFFLKHIKTKDNGAIFYLIVLFVFGDLGKFMYLCR